MESNKIGYTQGSQNEQYKKKIAQEEKKCMPGKENKKMFLERTLIRVGENFINKSD